MLPVDARRKVEGGVGALRESDDTNFLKPNGQSRNLNVYGRNHNKEATNFDIEVIKGKWA